MAYQDCELFLEICYGSDQTFDAVSWMETALQERAEALLAPLGPAYADMRRSGDGFGFVSMVRQWDSRDLFDICQGLSQLMDPQGRGRLVAVPAGLGPVLLWRFTAGEIKECVVSEGAPT